MGKEPQNKVAYVRNFDKATDDKLEASLQKAFIECLTPEEACEAFDLSFQQLGAQRHLLTDKIKSDIATQVEECHYTLIQGIIEAFHSFNGYHKRLACARSLEVLAQVMPDDVKEQAVKLLLTSEYRAFRKRAYKHIEQNLGSREQEISPTDWQVKWDPTYQLHIATNSQQYGDPECVRLMIEYFPAGDLEANFDSVHAEVEGTWLEKHLYRRVGEINRSKLDELAQRDEITAVYIYLQIGIVLQEEEAFTIYERNRNDTRAPLLVWCYGQMGLWTVLERIRKREGL